MPPNFVHSIDASHMRLFVDKMSEITNNFWSVHDAFGVHPNFGDELLKIGTKTFFEAHNCDGRGSLLHKLVHESLDLFDKKIEQTTVPSDESKSTKKTSGKADKLEEIYTKLTEITNSTDKDLVNAGDKVGYDLLIDKLTKTKRSELNQDNSIDSLNVDFDNVYLLS